jgi:hypothetical protein
MRLSPLLQKMVANLVATNQSGLSGIALINISYKEVSTSVPCQVMTMWSKIVFNIQKRILYFNFNRIALSFIM